MLSFLLLLLFVVVAKGERHVSLSSNHSCIVSSDQSIACLGSNVSYQSTSQIGPFQGVSVGDTFTCGLFMNTSAACWGTLSGVCSTSPLPIVLLAGAGTPALFLDISAGTTHVCGLMSNGTVRCYGDIAVPSSPSNLTFQAISSGQQFSVGVLRTGGLFSWGNVSNPAVSTALPTDTGFVEVAAGATHACALRWNGIIICFGDNSTGAVLSPVAAGSYVWISSGIGFTCGITVSPNNVNCWGNYAPSGRLLLTSIAELSCWNAQCLAVTQSSGIVGDLSIARQFATQNTTGVGAPASFTYIASSSSGEKLVAAVYNGYLYTSTDAGNTWTQRATSQNWDSVASSSDGTRLVAAVYAGYLYTSTDSGLTWTQRAIDQGWNSVASSSDGTHLIAAVQNGYLYTSSDVGYTWTQRATYQYWKSVASSSDGTRLVAAVFNGYLYTSIDSGLTWTQRATPQGWNSVASSSDGTHLIAAVFGGYLYTSTDSGATWAQRATSQIWFSVASSSDGTRLVAAAYNGYLYTSTDAGYTWTQWATSRGWSSVASSSDGYFVVGVGDGGAYVSTVFAFGSTASASSTISFASGASLSSTLTANISFAVWRMLAIGNLSTYGSVSLQSFSDGVTTLTPTNLLGFNTASLSLNLAGLSALSSLPAGLFATPAFGILSAMTLPTGNAQPLQIFPGTFSGLFGLNSGTIGVLNFTNTGIFVDTPGAFRWDALQGLTSAAISSLVLDFNAIQSISPCLILPSFLSHVKSLSIAHNSLATLDATSFTGFNALTSLALDYNNVSFVASDTISAFQQPLLSTVTFSNNPLPFSRCKAGFYNSVTSISAGGTIPSCSNCSVGFFCPGDGLAHGCPTGHYNNLVGQSSNSSCSACPVGSTNQLTGQTLLGCVSCPVGTASSTEGASDPSLCEKCSQGYYAGSQGLSLCQECPLGTFNGLKGATSSSYCVPCGLNTYSSTPHATSNTSCFKCPSGTFTSSTGASSSLQCTANAFAACAAGTQPQGISKPSSQADCIPLICLQPLLPDISNTSCVDGCGVGSYYSSVTRQCVSCNPPQVCPGFSIVFLSSAATNSGSPAPSFAPPSGNPGSSSGISSSLGSKLTDSCASQTPFSSDASAAGGSFGSQSPSVIAVVAIGCLVFAFAVCLGALAHTKSKQTLELKPQPHGICSFASLKKLFQAVDLFSVRNSMNEGEAITTSPSVLGGLFTIAGFITISCLALVLIIRRSEDNTISVASLSLLDAATLATDLTLPVSIAAASRMSGAAWTGVRIRIFSSSSPPTVASSSGASSSSFSCSNLASIPDAFSFGGLTSGGWQNTSISDCGGDGSTAALIFTCPSCVFSSTSVITIALPYQCQSLSIDAAAVTASGTLSLASIPYDATSAPAIFPKLLKNISWTLAPVLDFIDDQTTGVQRRGLKLTSLSQDSVYAPSGQTGIQPLSASITITISMPLQGYYSSTILTEKVTALQLVSSIIGLAGLLGAFGIVHSFTRKAHAAPSAIQKLTSKKRTRGIASSGKSSAEVGVSNPIHVSNHPASSDDRGAGSVLEQKASFSPSSVIFSTTRSSVPLVSSASPAKATIKDSAAAWD